MGIGSVRSGRGGVELKRTTHPPPYTHTQTRGRRTDLDLGHDLVGGLDGGGVVHNHLLC